MQSTPEKLANVDDLLNKINSTDAAVRTAAWLAAGQLGPAALRPLAKVAAEGDLEVARAANRAMWKIVRTVGAPAAAGKKEACAELAGLLRDDQPLAVHREVVWMLSEISDGSDTDVAAVFSLHKQPELWEDARCVLQRMPGNKAVEALQRAFAAAPEDFKPALADSLRRRGQAVDGYPSQKLVPTRETHVTPVGRT